MPLTYLLTHYSIFLTQGVIKFFKMTETFLFHTWQCRLFNNNNLFTPEGEPVQVIHPGILNHDAGPDFMNSRIRIGDTLWAGNVEIHIKSSDWNKHDHQNDRSYANIILHVVYDSDEVIKRPDGSVIPVLVLKDRINEKAWENYQFLLSNKQWIPCASQLHAIPDVVSAMQINRMLTERLERKTGLILDDLKINHQNWEESFYHHLARNFGFKTNAIPFELLAKALPQNVLNRHKASISQTEALLFGTAGFLNDDFNEAYPIRLKEEFAFLKIKFNIKSIDNHLWKFLRLRPANFPTIRIAQFCSLVIKRAHLFSIILETEGFKEIQDLLKVDVSPYWKSHFTFKDSSVISNKPLGISSTQNIIINTVVPFLFVYGTQKGIPAYRERALNFLEQLPPENNYLITAWRKHGLPAQSALQSQGLIELKNNYCDLKKCLSCGIGNKVLRGF